MARLLCLGSVRGRHKKNAYREAKERSKKRGRGRQQVVFDWPPWLDHEIWRLVLSDQIDVQNPKQLLEDWTWDDVMDAHAILDAIDDYEPPKKLPATPPP